MGRPARARPETSAEAAAAPSRLLYTHDADPGIRRRRCGKGFVYYGPDGQRVREGDQLRRIAGLAIPPAYSNVWICPLPHGHLQATARDDRGRKQYRYHAEWQRCRDADKFAHLHAFGRALPRVRQRVAADLRAPATPTPSRDAVLAALVRLLDTTLVRIGNEEYARSNGSFGLTTLRRRHAAVDGSRIRLRFRGKSGVPHEVDVTDPQVARIVHRCQDLPGQELFRYRDAQDELRCVASSDVNDYLRGIGGAEISAKDFRTWHASVLALAMLRRAPDLRVPQLIRDVASCLRNTAAVCRKSYVHPRVLQACESGEVPQAVRGGPRGLSGDERCLLRLIGSDD